MNPNLLDGPATRALVPGSVYGEAVRGEAREWSPDRSKLADHVATGGQLPVERDSRILYLGAGSGTTLSHVSDLADRGVVYGVDKAHRPMRTLLDRLRNRENVVPILADAKRPNEYAGTVELVNVLYQDVAQRDQVGIASRNAAAYLEEGGTLVLMVKSRSEDVTEDPHQLFRTEAERLTAFENVTINRLNTYPDHACITGRYAP